MTSLLKSVVGNLITSDYLTRNMLSNNDQHVLAKERHVDIDNYAFEYFYPHMTKNEFLNTNLISLFFAFIFFLFYKKIIDQNNFFFLSFL